MLPQMRLDGAAAELKVTANLIQRGYFPYQPVMDNTECDLVVDANGHLYKIQVKSAYSDGEKIKVELTRSSAKNRFYSKEDFDVLAIVDSTTSKIAYLVWANIPHKKCITLRLTETNITNGFTDKYGRFFFDDLSDFPLKELSELGNCSTDEINANDGGNRQAL